MPKDVAERDILIVDPMLATGGSAAAAIDEMKKRGCKHIKLMVLVAAPEGIEYLIKNHPTLRSTPARSTITSTSTAISYRVLGDAGDRIFGTITPPDLFAQGPRWLGSTYTRYAFAHPPCPERKSLAGSPPDLFRQCRVRKRFDVQPYAFTFSPCLRRKSLAGDKI